MSSKRKRQLERPDPNEVAREAVSVYEAAGKSQTKAAALLGIARQTFQTRLYRATLAGLKPDPEVVKKWSVKCQEFSRKQAAEARNNAEARTLLQREVREHDLRRRLQEAEKRLKQVIEEQATEERLIKVFERSISGFPAIKQSALTKRAPSIKSSGIEVPSLLFGDLHIGEDVSLEETYGINKYNFRVFQQRLERLEERTLDILTNHQKGNFPEMVVQALGDNISGLIHDELEKSEQHVVDQVYLGAVCVALFLYRLRALGPFPKLRVVATSGNHGRLKKGRPEHKRYYKNFDYLFFSIVATLLRNEPSIDIEIPKSIFTVVEIANHRILQSHGMELPPSSLGLPAYSINRQSANYQELLAFAKDGRYDYWVMGHIHRPMELDNTIVNGCMSGLTEFGIGSFKPIRPLQKLVGFHSKWGKAYEYPLRLDLDNHPTQIYTFEHDMAPTEALELFEERTNALKR